MGAYVKEVQSGAVDLGDFLERSRPDVVIYDFVQPAAQSTRWLRLIRPYDAEMARLAIREAASDDAHDAGADVDEDERGEAAA